jgi:tRNA U38,U39,U40 pseudouridine synthase TruA
LNPNTGGRMGTGVRTDTDLNTDFNLDLNSDKGDVYYCVDIVLDGALYKMIRNIIGGCLEVGYGTMSLDELKNILDEVPSRALNRIVTAPACGLYLEHVDYHEKLE